MFFFPLQIRRASTEHCATDRGEPGLRPAPAEKKGQDCWRSVQCWLTLIAASKMATDPLLGELGAWRSAESLAELPACPPVDSDNDVPEEVPTPQLFPPKGSMHVGCVDRCTCYQIPFRYIKW